MIHYEIKSGETLIYSSFRLNENFAATNIKLTEELNKVPTLTFDLPPNNHVVLEVMQDEVTMFRNNDMIFRGRVTQRRKKFDKSVGYTVEGDLGYLHDILVRPNDYSWTSYIEHDFFELFFVPGGIYNGRAATRQLVLGINEGDTISATDPYYVHLDENTNYPDCYDELFNHLDVFNGGYVMTRHVENSGVWTHYIDFIKTLSAGPQKIMYSRNILDINDDDDGRDIVTRYIPLGKTVDKSRTTLTPYDFIVDSDALERYGVIERKEDYSEVEAAATLRSYAVQDMAAMAVTQKKRSIKIKAVDMSIVGPDEPLQVGYVYEVFSHPHGIEYLAPETPGGEDNRKQLQRVEIDPNNPDKCYYWFGDVPKDSMRRIQADRARAEETRQRVLEEASYCNEIKATSSSSGGTTYSSQSGGSVTTGGNDLTTTSGHQTASAGNWKRVELFDTSSSASITLSNVNATVTVGEESASLSGTITADLNLSALNDNVNVWKTEVDVTIGKSVSSGSYVASVTDSNGVVIGCSIKSVSGATAKVTVYACCAESELPQNVNVSVVAIGTSNNNQGE